ncbi:DUF4157 domain-containing protein [Aquimarina litoralis]|uniref:eCIS core domain-containing protein n=1 Tax=Aquimarina litoralis TaxID=584605 RepID=UPI001C581735|nr:DUF4157 domain-containing protein [Aquimarina litoralis]
MAENYSANQQQLIQKKENKTGLPDNLKSGIENLSGYSMDNVKVHYNSDKPTQFQAHAYAQGNDIHLAAGQEKRLPHEAWHVVQQKQGRVKTTRQMKGNANINDDDGLEKEAHVMGQKALNVDIEQTNSLSTEGTTSTEVIQRNAFLDSLANAAGQIDYAVISGGGATPKQRDLYNGIKDAINKNRRNQAMLAAIQACGFGAEFRAYATHNGINIEKFATIGQDIRSSHSGGAIDPNLPQAAYETVPVANAGTVVSTAPPVLATLADHANYEWLKNTTTDHTTDPDHPKFRGPTATGGAKPTLGDSINPGPTPNVRLAPNANRVASYFELGAHSVHTLQDGVMTKVVSGTRVVFDPFSDRYFVSEHYAKQYELTNVPAATTHGYYARMQTSINNFITKPIYLGVPANWQKNQRENFLYPKIDKAFDNLS